LILVLALRVPDAGLRDGHQFAFKPPGRAPQRQPADIAHQTGPSIAVARKAWSKAQYRRAAATGLQALLHELGEDGGAGGAAISTLIGALNGYVLTHFRIRGAARCCSRCHAVRRCSFRSRPC
jgi:hypothetical protein